MITSNKTIRVRYDEVDRMGFVYHGNYLKYFHIGRTQLLRNLGICDITLENQNIIMPVIELDIRYIKPAFYDEKITVTTSLEGVYGIKMRFRHFVTNEQKEIISNGNSVLAFVNSRTRKPVRIPKSIIRKLQSIV